jgi:hypothetical protein
LLLLDSDRSRVSDRITAYALYTDPPLGRAGMTEALIGVGKQGNSIAAKVEWTGRISQIAGFMC